MRHMSDPSRRHAFDVIIRSHILIVGVDRTVKHYDSNVNRVSYADVKSMPPTRTSHKARYAGPTQMLLPYSESLV